MRDLNIRKNLESKLALRPNVKIYEKSTSAQRWKSTKASESPKGPIYKGLTHQ